MDNITISFIIPVYNVQDYLKSCLNSLILLDNNLYEILIIDDKSNDESLKIAKYYCKKYKNFRIIENDINLGVENTRNIGLRNAIHDWIVFLDSDDTISNFDFQNFARFLVLHEDIDIIFTGFNYIKDNEIKTINYDYSSEILTVNEFSNKIFSLISLPYIVCVGSKIYRKDFLMNNHIEFNKQYKYNEDLAFIFSALSLSRKVYITNETYYNYFFRSNSYSNLKQQDYFYTVSKARHLIKQFLIENNNYINKNMYFYSLWLETILTSFINDYFNKEIFQKNYDLIRNHEVTKEILRLNNLKKLGFKDLIIIFFVGVNNIIIVRLFIHIYIMLKNRGLK